MCTASLVLLAYNAASCAAGKSTGAIGKKKKKAFWIINVAPKLTD
jgi:hypothetical protein